MKIEVSILRVLDDNKLETIEMKELDFDNNSEDYEIIPVYPNNKDGIKSKLRINYYKEGDEER